MRNGQLRFTTTTLLLTVFFIAYVLASFCRGNYLLGVGTGLAYAVVASLVAILFIRALSHSPPPKLRIYLLLVFALPISLAFAFPMVLNPGVQHFLDKQTVDRNARAELAKLFAQDQAYGDLGVVITHLKCVNVEIRGSVLSRRDLDCLRSQVLDQCEFADHCFIHWHIHVRDERKT